MASGSIYPFDEVTFKDKDKEGIMKLHLDGLTKADKSSLSVSYDNKCLSIKIVVRGKTYGSDLNVEHIDPRKVSSEVHKGYVQVTVIKTKPFSLQEAAFRSN